MERSTWQYLCSKSEGSPLHVSWAWWDWNQQQPGRKRHPPFCRWPEGMALCRYTPGGGGECNHLFTDGNGKSQQTAAGRLSASSAQHIAWACGAEQGLWGWWFAPLVRRNEVVVLSSVSTGNHDFSVSGDYWAVTSCLSKICVPQWFTLENGQRFSMHWLFCAE